MKRTEPSRAAAPDPALLDYLGRYAEAADDFDPLGLDLPDASQQASPGKRASDPERR